MCARGYPRRIFYYIHLLAAAFRTAHNPRHIVCSRTARIYHDRARYVYIYISIRAPCPRLCAPRVHHKIGRFCAMFFTKTLITTRLYRSVTKYHFVHYAALFPPYPPSAQLPPCPAKAGIPQGGGAVG